MKCDKCKKQEATIHFTEVKEGKVVSHNLCQECAEHYGMKGAKFEATEQPSFSPEAKEEVLSELAQNDKGKKAGICPVCQSTMDDIKRTGRLGCGRCYYTFEDEIDVLMRRIQGSSFHVGRRADKPDERVFGDRVRIRELKKKLNSAVKKEDYEQAARLRDEIQKIEKRLEVS